MAAKESYSHDMRRASFSVGELYVFPKKGEPHEVEVAKAAERFRRLYARLQWAVKEERYMKAARIRDRMKQVREML